jgi:membrane-associated protease RseP (regulator of RpoE activity)
VRLPLHLEVTNRTAPRHASRCITLLLGVAAGGLALPAHAVGPRAGSKPPTYVVPPVSVAPVAPVAPIVIPDQPAMAAYDLFREALLEESPRGWFGIGLQCSDCSITREDSVSVWHFDEPPTIQYVDPDGPAAKAGLRTGDVLTRVDGIAITKDDGGRRFGAVKPGGEVRWTYERDGKTFVAKLVAEERPHRPLLVAPEVSADLATTLDKLRAEQERLRRESTVDSRHSYEKSLRQMAEVERALERTRESLRQRGVIAFSDAEAFRVAPRAQNLRYQGSIGGSEVEVRGSASIVVSEDEGDEELTITTPDATIHIRKK